MNIRIFSFPVFSFQFNVKNTDGVTTNKRTPITIISIDKIINTFISFFSLLYHNKPRTKIPKSFFMIKCYKKI